MYPDPSGNGQKRTKVIHDTTNPRFDDIFYFGITEVEMAETMLLVQVWDSDTLGNDDFLGEVIIKMNTFNFRDCPIHTAWYTLNSEVSHICQYAQNSTCLSDPIDELPAI